MSKRTSKYLSLKNIPTNLLKFSNKISKTTLPLSNKTKITTLGPYILIGTDEQQIANIWYNINTKNILLTDRRKYEQH